MERNSHCLTLSIYYTQHLYLKYTSSDCKQTTLNCSCTTNTTTTITGPIRNTVVTQACVISLTTKPWCEYSGGVCVATSVARVSNGVLLAFVEI